MKLKYEFIYQPLGDVTIAVPVGDAAKDCSGFINLNETGIEIMKMFETETSIDEAVKRLSQEYEADENVLRTAVVEVVEKLKKENLMV